MPAGYSADLPGSLGKARLKLFRSTRWVWLETLALVVYGVVVGASVAAHEAWADEAQAWQLARGMGWWQLMLHGVRYEGTPGLWHCLLWVLDRLHVSYLGMHWIAALVAAAGVVVLLRSAPFPRLLRLLLPFTFFLAYQDAIVARSYVLFTVLAFGAAALLRRRLGAPRDLWLLAVLLGLMANLSVHCFLASLGLALVAVGVVGRSRRPVAGPALLLGLCWAVAVATALPPPDVAFPAGKNIVQSWKKLGIAHQPSAPPIQVHPAGELTPVPPPVHHRTSLQNVERKLVRLLALITFPLSSILPLGLAAALVVVANGLRRRPPGAIGRIGLIPYGLLLTAFLWLYIAPRHTGVLFVTFLVTAWLTWPDSGETGRPTGWERALSTVLVLITVEQIGWTAHALWADIHGAYSGDAMTGAFLREHAQGKTVDGFYYHSVAVLPYLEDRQGFANQGTAGYWDWSQVNRTEAQAPFAWRRHPDYVVIGGFEWGNNAEITADLGGPDERGPMLPLGDDYRILPWFEAHGYRETHRFCGHAWMRAGYSELLCDVVLEPENAMQGPAFTRTR